MSNGEKEFIPRKRTLTDADLQDLTEMLHAQHSCRFDNITSEDMDFIKDLLSMYKETRSEVIKWVVKGIVYASLLLVVIGAWFKFSSKH